MPRFETAVRTPLRFRSSDLISVEHLSAPAETVIIECDGREFGWLALEPFEEGDYEPGPTVTVLHDDDAAAPLAAYALQRFLSALAFTYQVPIESVSYGSPGSVRQR